MTDNTTRGQLPALAAAQRVLGYFGAGAAILTGGFSELVAKPMRDVIKHRVNVAREILIEEL